MYIKLKFRNFDKLIKLKTYCDHDIIMVTCHGFIKL